MQTRTRALLKIGLLTNLLEWYEFSVYGYMVGTMSQLFFKSTHPTLALIQGFALFTASYLIRPLGSLFFGSIGDKVSREHALRASLLVMSIPTFLIGLLPTYTQVGNLATVSLLILRLIQGFGAGGESPVMGCYIFENAPSDSRGVLCSTVIISASIGILCGSMISTLLAWCFHQETILAWAWRLPFLLGIPITFYIFRIRQGILEIPEFQKPLLKNGTPVLSIVTEVKYQLLQAVLLVGFSMVCFYTLAILMPVYLTHFLGYPQKIASLTNTLTLCALPLFCLGSGYLSDLLGYRRIIIFSILAMLVSIYPIFLFLPGKSYGALLSIQVLYALLFSGIDALYMQSLGNIFSKEIRSSAMGLSLSLGASLFGGTTPFICTWLIHQTNWLMMPAFYIMVFGLLALLVAFRLKPQSE